MGFRNSGGVEVIFFADVPGVGSGLGSSAATGVSLLHALSVLSNYTPEEIDPVWLAETACHIQISHLKSHQGKQDEYACAIGGLNMFRFEPSDVGNLNVWRSSLPVSEGDRKQLSDHFMLFSPKDSEGRDAESILQSYALTSLFRQACKTFCFAFEGAVKSKQWGSLGKMIHKHYLDKCKLSPFVQPANDNMKYLDENGIYYKLCGAGATGHLLVATIREERLRIQELVEQVWGPLLPFRFVNYGSKIIYIENDG